MTARIKSSHVRYRAFNWQVSVYSILISILAIGTTFGQEGVTITTSDGIFARCFPDTLIEIEINVPSGHQPVDSFRLRWCRTCPLVSIPGSFDPPLQRNRYALSEIFEDNCAYDFNCLEAGICFSIDIVAFNADGTTDNNAFDIFFRFPPQPNFSLSSNTCLNQETVFANNTVSQQRSYDDLFVGLW